jgi:hypothetical protein
MYSFLGISVIIRDFFLIKEKKIENAPDICHRIQEKFKRRYLSEEYLEYTLQEYPDAESTNYQTH